MGIAKGEGHPIKVVARRVGLSPHVIRIWEKRYEAVVPQRTPTKRRLYSDADVERLSLLCRAIRGGRSIGQIAHLPSKKILTLIVEDEAGELFPQQKTSRGGEEPLHAQQPVRPNGEYPVLSGPGVHVTSCLTAVAQLDANAFESVLAHTAVAVGQAALIEHVVVPLMYEIGERWRNGELRVAHEHLASAVVRTFLGNLRGVRETPAVAPNLVVATPAGQMHEFGALAVAVTAESEGWRVTYLGTNLPAEEIAGAAQRRHARAVTLSIVYPPDDPHLRRELERLRRYLAEDVSILVGGRAAESYDDVLRAIGAVRLSDMPSLRAQLETLRSRPLH